MPQITFTDSANAGIRRCIRYLQVRSQAAAERAQKTIRRHIAKLERAPRMGRPFIPLEDEFPPEPDLRELVIPFGDGAYLALYRYIPEEDAVHVLAFKHGREAGY